MGELRIYIKQLQQYNIRQQAIYYDGLNPQSLVAIVAPCMQADSGAALATI